MTCADPEGGGAWGPETLKHHKNISFPSNIGPNLLKITKLPSQHSMWATIGPPAKRHFNGVSLAGRKLHACGVLGASLS